MPSAAPPSVTVHAVNSHTILVTWQSIPVEKVNGILEGYKVLYTDVDSNVPFEKLELNGSQTQLTKLKKFTMYKIWVLAFTNAGDGVPSECLYKRTDEDGKFFKFLSLFMVIQKQPSRSVLRKKCSENIQQFYRRTPMLKCDFNKVTFQL